MLVGWLVEGCCWLGLLRQPDGYAAPNSLSHQQSGSLTFQNIEYKFTSNVFYKLKEEPMLVRWLVEGC